LGWGMFPDSLAEPHWPTGRFVRINEVHLDGPVVLECWKLKQSPLINTITDAVDRLPRSCAGVASSCSGAAGRRLALDVAVGVEDGQSSGMNATHWKTMSAETTAVSPSA